MALGIIDPLNWLASLNPNTNVLEVDGYEFWVQNADKGYSISAPNADTLRFQVDAGDIWSGDPSTKNRSEISDITTYAQGTQINVSYGFEVEPGVANSAAWLVMGQFHQTGANASPPFEIEMIGEKMAVQIGFTNSAGAIVYATLWEDTANIVRGHNYDMQISANFNPTGGNLTIVRDGVTIVDYSGPLGWSGMGDVYWKEGIYRAASTTTIAADYSNLQISTSATPAAAAPVAPTVHFTENLGYNPGRSTTELVTNNGYVTLSGTATVGSVVQIMDGSTLLATTLATGTGAWTAGGLGTWTYSTTLALGQHALSASATLNGLTTTDSGEKMIDILPVLNLSAPIVTGVSSAAGASLSASDASTGALVINGTAAANTFVSVYCGGSLLGTTTANASGNWSYNDTARPFSNGTYEFAASATDDANASPMSSNFKVIVNTVIPVQPVISFTETLGYDSGLSSTDFITNNGNVKLTGTATGGAAISILDGTKVVGTTTASSTGAWSFSTTLGAGDHTLSATATYTGLTTTHVNSQVIDVLPVVSLAAPQMVSLTNASGVTENASNTDTGALIFKGTAAANTEVLVYSGSTVLGTTTANASGAWSFNDTATPLSNGTYYLQALSTDGANVSGYSSTFKVVVDASSTPAAVPPPAQVTTPAPAPSPPPAVAPTVSFSETLGYDSGLSQTDFVTNNGYVQLAGKATAGAAIKVMDGSTLLGSTTASSSGAWSFSKTLSVGDHTLSAIATTSGGSTTYVDKQVIDVMPVANLAAPTLTGISPNAGLSATDLITDSGAISINGTAAAGLTVYVYADNVLLGTTTANASGAWSYNDSADPLSNGLHHLMARVTDGSNVSGYSSTMGVTVDTTHPVVAVTGVSVNAAGVVSITGTGEAAGQVTVTESSATVATTTVNGSSTWSASLPSSTGVHTFLVNEQSVAGDLSVTPVRVIAGTSAVNTITAMSGSEILVGAVKGDTFLMGTVASTGTVIADFQSGDHLEFSGFTAANAQLTQIDSTHWKLSDGVHTDTFQLLNGYHLASTDWFLG